MNSDSDSEGLELPELSDEPHLTSPDSIYYLCISSHRKFFAWKLIKEKEPDNYTLLFDRPVFDDREMIDEMCKKHFIHWGFVDPDVSVTINDAQITKIFDEMLNVALSVIPEHHSGFDGETHYFAINAGESGISQWSWWSDQPKQWQSLFDIRDKLDGIIHYYIDGTDIKETYKVIHTNHIGQMYSEHGNLMRSDSTALREIRFEKRESALKHAKKYIEDFPELQCSIFDAQGNEEVIRNAEAQEEYMNSFGQSRYEKNLDLFMTILFFGSLLMNVAFIVMWIIYS